MLVRSKMSLGFVFALALSAAACGVATSNVSPTPEPSTSEPAASLSPDYAAALVSLDSAASALYADCVSEETDYDCGFTVDLIDTTLEVAKYITFIGANALLGSYVAVCTYDVDGADFVYRSGIKMSNFPPPLDDAEEDLVDGVDSDDMRQCPGATTP